MHAVDIIIKKRENEELTSEEIKFFVDGFTRGEIPEYQVSAWAMAVVLNGMTSREANDLTQVMAHSGEILDLSDVVDLAVDKHSSGGVGDKTTLVVLPIVVACGLPVGKMSGRGLGYSGGTLDKMESIPGYRVDLSTEEFKKQLKNAGIVLTGQTLDLAPADGKLYALRDVTGTVKSIPLIASSIMCKKIAGGSQAIVLDIKVGRGAFMETIYDARRLAELMIEIGNLAGRRVVTLLSDMNQPLGAAVGNSLEVVEAIDTLHNNGPADFLEHCLLVSAHMMVMGKKAPDLETGREFAKQALASGDAFEKFRVLVGTQGGDLSFVDYPGKFPQARYVQVVGSDRNGFLSKVDARLIGEAAVVLGAGRQQKEDPVDHAVGFIIHHKVGEWIEKGQPLFTIHANDAKRQGEALDYIKGAFEWSDKKIPSLPLFYS